MSQSNEQKQVAIIKREINRSMRNQLTITTEKASKLYNVFAKFKGRQTASDFADFIDVNFEIYATLKDQIEEIIGTPDKVKPVVSVRDWDRHADNVEDVLHITIHNTL
ncbi:hypothetical protein [Vibrio harveyi]|uniref:hypothetical protein n=1 Tax=Vibrio harveyi TaxID=669 RepID=UPI0023803E61|nr:hypothetical protein [Vibrio harveyi]